MTTTDRSAAASRRLAAASEPAEVFALLRRLVALLVTWSCEGTLRSEQIVKRVAGHYGADAEVSILPDSAVLTVGETTVACSRAPTVPPLDQVSSLKALLLAIEAEAGWER